MRAWARFILTLLCSFECGDFFGVDAFVAPSVSDHDLRRQLQLNAIGDNGESDRWLSHGLLLSSFSDGLKPNQRAIDFLMKGLVASLWKDRREIAETHVAESVIQSPCCGPDLEAVESMESVDDVLVGLQNGDLKWKDILQTLASDGAPLEMRFLYIPTAMYALRSDSNNSPGKQRQRARADGKKRRTEIIKLLSAELGEKVEILSVTLDLDDSSIKQPEGSDDTDRFPKDGNAAFQDWKPNFIYVQGGNTFWLHHCIEKGGWESKFYNSLTGDNAAVYCGTSAGAIVMGQCMETACWKEWDDPTVVPGRQDYSSWNGIKGFGLAGNMSFFPHMDDRWTELVAEKEKELKKDQIVHCLMDEEVCCVDGSKQEAVILTSSAIALN